MMAAVQHVIDPGAHGCGGISPPREPHQLEWVGPMKISPCHSKRSGQPTPCDVGRPRLPPRGLAPAHAPKDVHWVWFRSGPTMRFSEPRFRLPISATRFRHAGTPVSRRSPSVRGCHPCPRCSSRWPPYGVRRRAEEPCRLPFSSAPSLAGDVPYLSVPGAGPMVWPAGRRGELIKLL